MVKSIFELHGQEEGGWTIPRIARLRATLRRPAAARCPKTKFGLRALPARPPCNRPTCYRVTARNAFVGGTLRAHGMKARNALHGFSLYFLLI